MPRAKKEVKEYVKPEAKKEPKYTVELIYNGETEILKGDDLVEIFNKWEQRIFKTIVLLSVTCGKSKFERRLSIIEAKRIAGNYTNAGIFANNVLKFLE